MMTRFEKNTQREITIDFQLFLKHFLSNLKKIILFYK